jgi:SAM-dependent methyltransferase
MFRGTDRLYRTTDKVFSVVACAGCRLVRLHPWPTPEELQTYYPENYWFSPQQDATTRAEEAYRRFVLRDHVNFAVRALESSSEKGPVLDVGCGGGLFLHMLKERGYSVAGLDFSVDAAAVAWKVQGVPVVCADFARAPLAEESCAAVTMYHVVEHLYDPAAYLDAAMRVLKPDGRLIVQVPNASSWQSLLLGENWSGADVPRHLINFRASDLEVLLDNCGFEVVRWKHFSLRDNPAGLATSLMPALDPMARRIRGIKETADARLFKNLAYFGLMLACIPFALLEAACCAGSTVMVEARKKR